MILNRIRQDGRSYLIITQEELIKKISKREDIDIATVRKVFKSAENCIFDYLSSTSPITDVLIKIFHGFTISRKYIPEKKYSKGMFKNYISQEHCNISSSITKYYKDKINSNLFN